MNFFRIALRKTWRCLFFVNGILTFMVFFPVFYVLLKNENWFGKVFKLKRIWAKFLINNVGIRQRIIRDYKLDPKRAYVICPNHGSYLDIILTYISVPVYFHFMGKAELKKVPFFNQFFDKMNILVDRGSIIGSHKAFIRAAQDIDKGISIAIFPEATIPESAPVLGRMKNGAFKLAIEKQVPIVPVVYIDNWRLLPDGHLKCTGGCPGITRVYIHDPIETKGLTENDLSSLKKQYEQLLTATLKEYGSIHADEDCRRHEVTKA